MVKTNLRLVVALILALSILIAIGLTLGGRSYLSRKTLGQSLTPPPSPTIAVAEQNASEAIPSNTIIFAGLSGVPPRFIESGVNRGMGWQEFETQEVRKGMRDDGFILKQEWMTPARIAHEVREGHPICTYPAAWNDPNTTFAKKPDRIYSIALDFGEERARSILFNKADSAKFQKHLDAKGDLNLTDLLEDHKLKTLLVRNEDYGSLTRKLTDINERGDQFVREKYQDHVSLWVTRDNRQLIEMLNAKRFDYIISDAIEDQDFKVSGLKQESFVHINFSTTNVKDSNDPSLTMISIACSIHPSTLAAMPYLNKWINLTRGPLFSALPSSVSPVG